MPTLTLLHVVISLIAIGAGFPFVSGLLAGRVASATTLFLLTTFLTSLTGFLFFPLQPFLPSHVVGLISIVLLCLAGYAVYVVRLAGPWRAIYVVTGVMAFYLNVFVLVVQAFLKVPALHALAPTQGEPPFAIAQGIVLLVFAALAILGLKRFHPAALATRARRG